MSANAMLAEWEKWSAGGLEHDTATQFAFLDLAHENGWIGESQLDTARTWIRLSGPSWLDGELRALARSR